MWLWTMPVNTRWMQRMSWARATPRSALISVSLSSGTVSGPIWLLVFDLDLIIWSRCFSSRGSLGSVHALSLLVWCCDRLGMVPLSHIITSHHIRISTSTSLLFSASIYFYSTLMAFTFINCCLHAYLILWCHSNIEATGYSKRGLRLPHIKGQTASKVKYLGIVSMFSYVFLWQVQSIADIGYNINPIRTWTDFTFVPNSKPFHGKWLATKYYQWSLSSLSSSSLASPSSHFAAEISNCFYWGS